MGDTQPGLSHLEGGDRTQKPADVGFQGTDMVASSQTLGFALSGPAPSVFEIICCKESARPFYSCLQMVPGALHMLSPSPSLSLGPVFRLFSSLTLVFFLLDSFTRSLRLALNSRSSHLPLHPLGCWGYWCEPPHLEELLNLIKLGLCKKKCACIYLIECHSALKWEILCWFF